MRPSADLDGMRSLRPSADLDGLAGVDKRTLRPSADLDVLENRDAQSVVCKLESGKSRALAFYFKGTKIKGKGTRKLNAPVNHGNVRWESTKPHSSISFPKCDGQSLEEVAGAFSRGGA